MKKVEIEVQYFHGCPHADEMLRNVKQAIYGLESFVYYIERIVDTPQKAFETGFRGSPTVLMNGVDFESMPQNNNPSLNCRLYPKGLPSIELIKERILMLSE